MKRPNKTSIVKLLLFMSMGLIVTTWVFIYLMHKEININIANLNNNTDSISAASPNEQHDKIKQLTAAYALIESQHQTSSMDKLFKIKKMAAQENISLQQISPIPSGDNNAISITLPPNRKTQTFLIGLLKQWPLARFTRLNYQEKTLSAELLVPNIKNVLLKKTIRKHSLNVDLKKQHTFSFLYNPSNQSLHKTQNTLSSSPCNIFDNENINKIQLAGTMLESQKHWAILLDQFGNYAITKPNDKISKQHLLVIKIIDKQIDLRSPKKQTLSTLKLKTEQP